MRVAADGERLVVGDRRGHAELVVTGIERFGTFQAADGILTAPIRGGIHGEARGPRVDVTSGNRPAIFAGFGAVKSGKFHARFFVGVAEGQHVIGNMRRILQVVAERRERVFAGGYAMRKRFGPERGIADRRGVKREERIRADFPVVKARPAP